MDKRLIMGLLLALLPALGLADVCPTKGDGGDSALNSLKNRTTEPTSYRELAVAQFLQDFTPDLHTPRYTNRFSASQKAYITPRESEGIALTGYLLGAKQSGPESTNCHSQSRRDFHLWVGAERPRNDQEAKAMRAASVVVEPTPSGQEGHPSWRLHMLQKLARQHAQVRISGWAMYDPEHPDQLGKTRGTLWEVHPVMKIEVWNNSRWQEL